MLRRINEGLPGLVAGILIYGGIVQLTGVWFVEDRMGYSIGLWYGIAIAIGMAVNMAYVIYDAVTFDGESKANGRVIAKSMLRYVVVVILFCILGLFEFGNIITAFIGVMGLKFSAYMQPLFAWLINKISGRDDAASDMDDSMSNSEEESVCSMETESSEQENMNKEVTL